MTTFQLLMSLAQRTFQRGEPDAAGQMSVLALEALSDDKGLLDDDNEPTQQMDADKDALNEQPLLEALENGDTDPSDTDSQMGGHGETPIATVLELAALTKKLGDIGYLEQARALNRAIVAMSAGYQPDFSGVKVATRKPARPMSAALRRRWALLCAKLLSDGKQHIAADVVAVLRMVRSSEVKQFNLMDGDAPELEELKEMLDEVGYESVMKMGEKRRKELENGPPGISIPMSTT